MENKISTLIQLMPKIEGGIKFVAVSAVKWLEQYGFIWGSDTGVGNKYPKI